MASLAIQMMIKRCESCELSQHAGCPDNEEPAAFPTMPRSPDLRAGDSAELSFHLFKTGMQK